MLERVCILMAYVKMFETDCILNCVYYIFRNIIPNLCCDNVYKSCGLFEIPVALGSKNGSVKPFTSLFRHQLS